jgi:DNA-binding transcriptional ArsR family regulator
MSKNNMQRKKGSARLGCEDLVKLILQPLADQINQTRLQILEKVQKVADSAEIIARELARRID